MQLSFVLLAQPAQPDGAAVARSYAKLFPAERPPVPAAGGGDVAELKNGDLKTFVAAMPAPVPGGEAESAVQFSLSAVGGFKLGQHHAHFIVTTQAGDLDAVEALVAHTRVVAAVVDAHNAMGVYEGNANATHGPEFYVDVASSIAVPLVLWNGVSIVKNKKSIEFLTLGMGQLDLPDMLLTASEKRSDEALGFLFDLLGYIVDRRRAIAEGETVGRSPSEKLPIKYVASPLDPATKVARVRLP